VLINSMQTTSSSGALTISGMKMYIYPVTSRSATPTARTRAERTGTTDRMTIFFEETSLPNDILESTEAEGISAPPPTPVEYFQNEYVGTTGSADISGIYEAAWASWGKLQGGASDNWLDGVVPSPEIAEGTLPVAPAAQEEEGGPALWDRAVRGVTEAEVATGRRKRRKVAAEAGATVPRAKRVYRNCRACGTRNHNRRLFCTGCYGGKDEMGKVEGTGGR